MEPAVEVPLERKWGYPKVLPSKEKNKNVRFDREDMGLLGRMQTLNDKVQIRRNNLKSEMQHRNLSGIASPVNNVRLKPQVNYGLHQVG